MILSAGKFRHFELRMLKKIRHLLEFLGFGFALILFRFILPFKCATAIAGWVGRTLGPRCLPRSSLAMSNLEKCFPSYTDAQREAILVDVWDNYARFIVEYMNPEPFWDGKTLHNIEIVGAEHLKNLFEGDKPGILFTAHFGNWQMALLAARSMGYDITQFYKATSNPLSDRIMQYCQKLTIKNVITKQEGPKAILSLLKRGEHLLILVDQKAGEGIPVPFLGHDALTATGWVRIAQSQGCPLLPVRSERLSGTSFRVTFYPPMTVPQTGDKEKDIFGFLLSVNTMIGEWVKKRPGQWFWLHRRWKDS